MTENKKFEAISLEDRSDLEELLVRTVNDRFRRERIEENFYYYVVELQGNKFKTAMTASEVEESATLTINLLEELKNMNNNGLNRSELKKIVDETNRTVDSSGVVQVISIWMRISTDKLRTILSELDRVRRVGGAWAILIADPILISAIYAVYERIVDAFDDEELYSQSAFFLMRAVMKMHSDELQSRHMIQS